MFGAELEDEDDDVIRNAAVPVTLASIFEGIGVPTPASVEGVVELNTSESSALCVPE